MNSLTSASATGTEAAPPKAPLGAEGVPCLHSDISTGNQSQPVILTAQHRRTAHILSLSVFALSRRYGIENIGFLTLTFRDHVVDPAEAQRRLNSLLTHVIKRRYLDYIGVMERQKSGRIHYHLLVALDSDIRTGCDFGAFTRQDYTSAPSTLRAEWSFWRKTAPLYRFGRTELLPVKTDSIAIAFYVGKYIGKHVEQRQECDKGVRLVRYSRGARIGTTRFQFVSPGSAQWRAKVALFAQMVGDWFGVHVECMDQLKAHLGPRWAYNWREFIMGLEPEQSQADSGDGMGERSEAGHADCQPLGNNTESAATSEPPQSIVNKFNDLPDDKPGSPVTSIFELFRGHGDLLAVDCAPQDTLPEGVQGGPTPCTPAQRRASFFSRDT